MALVKCPDCGRDVSSLAPACPNCSRLTKSEPLDAPPEVWAEINKTLDAEAEEYKASLRKALESLTPEDNENHLPPSIHVWGGVEMGSRRADLEPPFKKRRDRVTYHSAQTAVRGHVKAVNKLRDLGVVRSERSVQSDFSEWIASNVLGLRLSPNRVEESHDATRRGKKYEIKSRVVSSLQAPTSFDFRSRPKGFDLLVCVFFDSTFGVLGIAEVPRSAVIALGSQTKRRFSFRWNRRTRNDRRIKWKFRSAPFPKPASALATAESSGL